MPKQIVPRTAVTPNGGIYRIDRRNIPQVEDLGVVDGKQHWRTKEDFTYDLGHGVKVTLQPPNWPEMENLPRTFSQIKAELNLPVYDPKDITFSPLTTPGEIQRRRVMHELQFMWDSMPLEMKQDIIARYHPHNCVKKEH
jgi:hypothetical protein